VAAALRTLVQYNIWKVHVICSFSNKRIATSRNSPLKHPGIGSKRFATSAGYSPEPFASTFSPEGHGQPSPLTAFKEFPHQKCIAYACLMSL